MIRTSEAYEIVRNDPIHVTGISAGQVIKREKKKSRDIMDGKLPNLIENIHPRRLINFEQGKQKKFPTLRHSTVAP